MTDITPFSPATPAMVVGQTLDGSSPPLGLGEPFALHGGDRLGPDGIALRIMHEHQPAFRRWVVQNCEAALAAERPWFRGRPLLLTGAIGAGRTHAARWLARAIGVPHVVLNLSDPIMAGSIAASRRVNEALWASPITIAMAATRCANPVISVVGTDQASADVQAGLATMIDPDTGRLWSEDQLGIMVDLGEVTWILQCEQLTALSSTLRNLATPVALSAPPSTIDSVFALSIVLEAMADMDVEPSETVYGWRRIKAQLTRHHFVTGKALYSNVTNAIMRLRQAAIMGAEGRVDDDLPSDVH